MNCQLVIRIKKVTRPMWFFAYDRLMRGTYRVSGASMAFDLPFIKKDIGISSFVFSGGIPEFRG